MNAAARRSAARFLQGRVLAVRTELTATAAIAATWARTAERALRRDLLALESRLAEVIS